MSGKRKVKYVLIVLAVIFCMLLVKGQFEAVIQDNYNDSNAEVQSIAVKDKKIEQILPLQSIPSAMNFIMVNASGQEEHIVLELWDSEHEKCYGTQEIGISPSNGGETIIAWNLENIALSEMEQIMIVLNGTDASEDVYVSVQDDTTGQSYYYEGQAENGHIRMNVVYGAEFHWGFFLMFGIVMLVMLLGCVYAWEKKLATEKLFVVIALSGGMLIAMINPLGNEPDGWVHMIRAMDVSYGNVLRPFLAVPGTEEYVIQPANRSDIDFKIIEPNAGAGGKYLENLKNVKFSEETTLAYGLYDYSSLFYYPQALGIFLGRLFGISIYGCSVLGKWMNLWCYVLLTYWGIKKIPIYKNLMMVVALLPMTIYQAASFSYDTLINGFSFLFIGLCFYYAFGEKEKLSWKNLMLLGVILALIFTCKYIYVILGLLVFLIPKERFGTKKEYWKAFGIAIIPLLVILLLYLVKMVSTQAGASAAVSVEETVQITQLDYVKQNPLTFIKVIVGTLISNLGLYMEMLNTLGWLNYSLNILQTIVPFILIAVACLDTDGVRERIKIHHQILCFITAIVVVVMGMVGLYLMDNVANSVGAEVVTGYQTRYAIPVLLPLLAILGNGRVENRIIGFSTKVSACMSVCLLYTIVMLMRLCY